MRKVQVLSAALITLLLCAVAFAQSNQANDKSRGVGTWKLDAKKSKFGQLPAPKSQTIEVTKSSDDELAWTAHTVGPKGTTISESWSGKPDGNMQPMKEDPNAQASFKWEGDKLIGQMKDPNGIEMREEIQLSPDNKTMIINRNAKGPNGDVSATAVYDREK